MEKWKYQETFRQCQRYICDEYCIRTQTDNLAGEMISNNLLSYHKRLYISEITHEEKKIHELIEHLRDPNYPTIQTAFDFLLDQFTSEGYPHISQKLQQTLEEVAKLEHPPDEPPHEAVQRLYDNIDNITRNQMRVALKQLRAQIVPQGFEDVEVQQEDHNPATHHDMVDTNDDSYTALMKATVDGDLALVTHIITTDPQCVNDVNKRGEDALMVAVKHSSLQIVGTILGCELIDVNLMNHEGRTAIMHDIGRGNIEIVTLLLDTPEVNTALCDKKGLTCEYYAFGNSMLTYLNPTSYRFDRDTLKREKNNLEWNKKTNIIKYLLTRPNINQTNLMKICLMLGDDNVLQMVVQSGWKATVIENGQNFIVNIIITTNPILVKLLSTCNIKLKDIDTTEVVNAIHSVMHYNCPDTCAALLGQVTDMNVDNVLKTYLQLQCIPECVISHTLKHSTFDMTETTTQGWTVFMLACQCGSVELVSHLLQFLKLSRKDLDTRDKLGITAFHIASGMGRGDIVSILTQCESIDINTKDNEGCTALHFASMRGHSSVVETLIQCPGIDINTPAKSNTVPLHMACMLGRNSVVETLIKCPRIDINTPDESGMTPLHFASIKGHSLVVETLIQCPGININTQDTDGWTPLHLASSHGYSEIVKTLVQCPGININTQDMEGITALHFASVHGYSEIVKTLVQCPGINTNTPDK